MKEDRESYQRWWESTWTQREELIRLTFGPTQPPNSVLAFYWDDFEIALPGACALVFPPVSSVREEWLTVTHGLSQPSNPNEVRGDDDPSGQGYELAFVTNQNSSWPAESLKLMITYLRQSQRPIAKGHRIPFWFWRHESGFLVGEIGHRVQDSNLVAVGDTRAVLFWPYLARPSALRTDTGQFTILVGTTITEDEWQLAKTTSSAHLLLLLSQAGVGQISDPERRSAIAEATSQKHWEHIVTMRPEEAERELVGLVRARRTL